MDSAQKIIMAACLFAGFLWIRGRARKLELSNRRGRTVIGIFGVLPALLLGGKYLFDTWPIPGYTGVLLRIMGIGAAFAVVGLLFLKSGLAAETQGTGTSDSGESEAGGTAPPG